MPRLSVVRIFINQLFKLSMLIPIKFHSSTGSKRVISAAKAQCANRVNTLLTVLPDHIAKLDGYVLANKKGHVNGTTIYDEMDVL